MAKRRFKNKKVRYVAIGSSVVTVAAVATVLLPSANAAEEKTPEQVMELCRRAEVLNGKKQSLDDFGGHPIAGPSFGSDNCDFVETKFETFDGPTEKVTVDFPNCEPNATEPSKVTTEFSKTVAQGQGKYTVTQQGALGGLFGALSGSWVKHKGTLDMNIKSATASESEQREVPVGKVMHVTFTPKMQRMTGEWRVRIDANPGSFAVNPTPEQNFVAPEVVEGPVVLEGAAGTPGLVDGTTKVVLEDC
ncbi:hypothetical protein Sipo8835_22680 [Streptomyces ipomoeae]|uniref:Gram-positive signal peptide protein, YSIRK family n=2 Tax=Streptomyces ipomoeae TaxID=103232 RepID=L1L1D4_9ACTN|nr:hypothetical protein [Streptomyces ipomoeae]EKX66609.1 Gram-positive signal peptide protein, YSIRK family [Streptomyces ipomoeae 91-03]MDX2699946.1 hypothetical protein [Streptomyces ipomoeae]MDX2826983.1 hypothetical protein [Streptomyces ipomoeae]MDX2842145.1 hypothetical protein [Streptomyces ipomoeae]MDX2879627.1 hypothetical protein [Streptomyces ipomoeae]